MPFSAHHENKTIIDIIEMTALALCEATTDPHEISCNASTGQIMQDADEAMAGLGARNGKEMALSYAANKKNDGPERFVAAFLAAGGETADHPSAKLLAELGIPLRSSPLFMLETFAKSQIKTCPQGSAREAGLRRIIDAQTETATQKSVL